LNTTCEAFFLVFLRDNISVLYFRLVYIRSEASQVARDLLNNIYMPDKYKCTVIPLTVLPEAWNAWIRRNFQSVEMRITFNSARLAGWDRVENS